MKSKPKSLMPERHLFAMLILREVSPLRAWMLFLLLALAAGLALLLLPLPATVSDALTGVLHV